MNQPVILITGAFTGIGRITSIHFSIEGSSLVVSGRRERVGQVLTDERWFRQKFRAAICVSGVEFNTTQ